MFSGLNKFLFKFHLLNYIRENTKLQTKIDRNTPNEQKGKDILRICLSNFSVLFTEAGHAKSVIKLDNKKVYAPVWKIRIE